MREFVRRNPREKLATFLPHVSLDALRSAFYHLRKDASAGVDGTTWQQNAVGLDSRLVDLHDRVHSGAYRGRHCGGFPDPTRPGVNDRTA